jgi:hypothetical protein
VNAKFGKSRLEHATEIGAHELVLLDPRFQKPARPVKARILELLNVRVTGPRTRSISS